jgi:hypothetical protein
MSDDEVARLRKELQECNEELQRLRGLTLYPTLLQGMKGETLVAKATGGEPTNYGCPHDLQVKNGDRLEVKYSKLARPNSSKAKRWS